MAQLPQLQLPAITQRTGAALDRRRQAATATSAGITGLQIQELLARIKAKEATELQTLKETGLTGRSLIAQQVAPPAGGAAAGDDPGTRSALDELRGNTNFLKSAQGSKLAAEIGVFPQDRQGASVRDIVSGREPNLRATPLEILKNTALNPSTKVGQDVKTKTIIGQGGKALGPSVRTVTDKTETKGPASGLPGLGLPGTTGAGRSAVEGESERLQAEALGKMQASLDASTIKAIFSKLKAGEIITGFDPDTKTVIIRRPGGRTRRAQ